MTFQWNTNTKRRLVLDRTYNVGSLEAARGQKPVLGPFSVDEDSTHFRTVIDKTSALRPGVRIDCTVEVSYDGGTTWQERGTESDIGGQNALDDEGQPITDFIGEYDLLPQVGQTPRQCRVVIHAVNGAFTSVGGSVKTRRDAVQAAIQASR